MGFSQESLARKIGVTRQTINLIEAGKYNPSLKICKGIARELNATLDELFGD
jgi:putative transcriptional regulator